MDVKELLARLGEQPSHSPSPSIGARQSSFTAQYQPPSVSSPIVSPPVKTPEPRHGDVLSLNATTSNTPKPEMPAPSSEHTNTLLNLLKFNNAPPRTPSMVASAASPPLSGARAAPPAPEPPSNRPTSTGNQDLLLNLLKRQNPISPPPTIASRPPQPEARTSFNFVSPFNQLSMASAPVQTHQPEASVAFAEAAQESKEVDPPIKQEPESVSEALESVANQASKEAQEALQDAASKQLEGKAPPQAEVADSWDAPIVEATDKVVRVFNFPMKPFTSIEFNGKTPQTSRVRDEIVMKIASLKKEFDQVDRNLATASANFIAYCMSKGGGVRVIRQDDGTNKTAFRGEDKQIFNLAVSGPDGGAEPEEALLATSVNGSVYWTSIPTQSGFDQADLDQRGFAFPPATSQEDPTSTAQLKTRAKLSSRHPEFFAIGRGKSIHIIWPKVALTNEYIDPAKRIVDSGKYLAARCLKIATGKAGKDFAFSADDTLIVTLDKAGRLKFWDITSHTDPANGVGSGPCPPIEVKVPTMTLWAASPTEKSSPTSVLFVDKERPTVKGFALRYMIVGMKQNHTIQLWDLGLGKAVQELNFPHDNENDAICSIAYHAKSGIIVVGHPTRNSIYLIHLSAPRYNLPAGLTQADFISKLAANDDSLPKPDSTAIMSGVRELSFQGIGQLRSLDTYHPLPNEPGSRDEEDSVFEIYAMHSKGVTCLHIKQSDLGWSFDGRVLHPADAEAEGVISVSVLRQPSLPQEQANGDSQSATDNSKQTPYATPKESSRTSGTASTNGEEKKKKKRGEDLPGPEHVQPASSYAKALSKPSPATAIATEPSQSLKEQSSDTPAEPAIVSHQKNTFSTTVSEPPIDTAATNGALEAVFNAKFDDLYKRLDDDKRVMEASGYARQDALLRLVSSTLTDNTEKSLGRIVKKAVAEDVMPAVSRTVKTTVDEQFPKLLSQYVDQAMAKELKTALSGAIAKSSLSDQVLTKISGRIEADIKSSVNNILAPAFKKHASEAAQKMTQDVDRRIAEQMKALDASRQKDAAKIEELTNLVQVISTTLQAMSEQQLSLQRQVIELKAQLSQQVAPAVNADTTPFAHDPEARELAQLLEHVDTFEQGLIKWIQSPRQNELFESVVVNVDTVRVQELQPVVALSVLATISSQLMKQTAPRIDWLHHVLSVTNVQTPEASQYAPQVLALLSERLQEAYMQTSEDSPGSPLLSRIHAVHKMTRDMKNSLA